MPQNHKTGTAGKQVPYVLADLNSYKQWVGYNADKEPLNPRGGKAKAGDPSTWGTRAEANKRSPGKVGIEFGPIVGRDDLCLAGVDLDGCRDDKNVITPWAREIITKLGTYVELSPSGKGLHALFLYRPSDLAAIEAASPSPTGGQWKPAGGVGIELYFRARYFTVTDDQFGQRSGLKILDGEEVKWIVAAGAKLMAGNVSEFPKERSKKVDEAVELAAIMSGENYHGSMLRLTGLWSAQNVPYVEAFKKLRAAFDAVAEADRDERWKERCKTLTESLQYSYGKKVEEKADMLGGFGAIPDFDQSYDDLIGYSAEEWREFAQQYGWGGSSSGKGTLNFHTVAEMRARPDAHDFVEGVLFDNQLSALIGKWGSWKSFVVLDLGMHIALGWPWHGLGVERGGVIIISLEGVDGIRRRFDAWCLHHGIEDRDAIPIAFADGSFDVRKGKTTRLALIDYAKAKAVEWGMPVRWIVIDTLARGMAGGNENSSEDMGAFRAGMDHIRNETHANVGVVHHHGKDASKGARGSSSLPSDVDTELEIGDDEDGVRILRLNKQKEGPDGLAWAFMLQTDIDLGYESHWGKRVTSCVVLPVPLPAKTVKRGQWQAGVLTVLHEMAGIGRDGILEDELLEACRVEGRISKSTNEGSRRDLSKRAFQQLIAEGALFKQADLVFEKSVGSELFDVVEENDEAD